MRRKLRVTFLLMITLIPLLLYSDSLTLWYDGLVAELPYREEHVKLVEENARKVGLNLKKDYGPASLEDSIQRFIIQGKTGSPDVLETLLEHIYILSNADLICPLNKYWENYEKKDSFYESAVEAVTIDGNLYAIPHNVNVRLLLYRKSIFEKYGLSIPQTWEDLIKTGSWITQNVPDTAGFALTTKFRDVRSFQEFMSFYFQLNENMFITEGESITLAASPEQLIQVLKLYEELFQSGAIPSKNKGISWQELDYGYTSGKYAMIPCGPWIWQHKEEGNPIAEEIIEDTGIVILPIADNGEKRTYMEVRGFVINNYSKNKDDAWKLATLQVSEEMEKFKLLKKGNLSARKDIMEEYGNWWSKAFAENIEYGVVLDPINWDKATVAISNAIQYVVYNKMSAEEAGNWLYKELSDIAKSL